MCRQTHQPQWQNGYGFPEIRAADLQSVCADVQSKPDGSGNASQIHRFRYRAENLWYKPSRLFHRYYFYKRAYANIRQTTSFPLLSETPSFHGWRLYPILDA